MVDIQRRRDLARLPEPRTLYAPSALFRMLVGGFAVASILAGAARSILNLISWNPDPIASAMAAAAVAAGLTIWIVTKPGDWREWIDFAATGEGLYLPGRKRRVVFVPWSDVLDITVETWPSARGRRSIAKLSIRQPEEAWARFSRLASLEGRGPVRTYFFRTAEMTGERLAAELEAYRQGQVPKASP